ncbi:MAG: hypothetical protein OER90_07650 [Gemmatimonadota bacterium]|nr:hypothetical protein [Gemmatimonadota bacterium]
MPAPPSCTALGNQCRELEVTIRIADLDDDSPTLQDAAATWVLAHRQHISMGKLYRRDGHVQVDAVLHVPCKYLEIEEGQEQQEGQRGQNGKSAGGFSGNWTEWSFGRLRARCTAHRFRGTVPASIRASANGTAPLRRSDEEFQIVFKGKQRVLDLPLKRAARRALPVVEKDNPCVGAPCRTADNTQGAACCRDLSLDVVVSEFDEYLEALLKSRKPPYLCKVKRESPETVECEIITACGYLAEDGIHCVLHDRVLPNGRLAKPSICYEWPDLGPDDTGHPGCRLL